MLYIYLYVVYMLYICLYMFIYVYICLYMFIYVYICLYMFIYVIYIVCFIVGENHTDAVKVLLDHGATVDIQDAAGRTPLYVSYNLIFLDVPVYVYIF